MIREVLKDVVISFIEQEHLSYKITNDPYEKFLIYEKNGILGFLSFSIIYDRAEINYIYVKKKYRNMKIGTLLLKYSFEKMKKENVFSVSLEVNENNIFALKLYNNFGFEKCAIRKNYYKDGNGFLLMRKFGDENE